MIDDLGGVTSALAKLALDAAVLRHQVIANNIANAQTPGFRPQYVSFEEYLSAAAGSQTGRETDAVLRAEVESLRERLDAGQLVHSDDVTEVNVDQEMARLSANVLRYQALLEGLSKRGDLVKMAISGEGGR